MSKVDDKFAVDKVWAEESTIYAEISPAGKQQMKDLMLELIDQSVEQDAPETHRWVNEEVLRQKVNEL